MTRSSIVLASAVVQLIALSINVMGAFLLEICPALIVIDDLMSTHGTRLAIWRIVS